MQIQWKIYLGRGPSLEPAPSVLHPAPERRVEAPRRLYTVVGASGGAVLSRIAVRRVHDSIARPCLRTMRYCGVRVDGGAPSPSLPVSCHRAPPARVPTQLSLTISAPLAAHLPSSQHWRHASAFVAYLRPPVLSPLPLPAPLLSSLPPKACDGARGAGVCVCVSSMRRCTGVVCGQWRIRIRDTGVRRTQPLRRMCGGRMERALVISDVMLMLNLPRARIPRALQRSCCPPTSLAPCPSPLVLPSTDVRRHSPQVPPLACRLGCAREFGRRSYDTIIPCVPSRRHLHSSFGSQARETSVRGHARGAGPVALVHPRAGGRGAGFRDRLPAHVSPPTLPTHFWRSDLRGGTYGGIAYHGIAGGRREMAGAHGG
ncbi:hypothetical protein DFH06DRAFT_1482648 [Mycena polygramma]|nr:hypothetical protein DFH06DRAFT_1482648 [Mycena polygramma]